VILALRLGCVSFVLGSLGTKAHILRTVTRVSGDNIFEPRPDGDEPTGSRSRADADRDSGNKSALKVVAIGVGAFAFVAAGAIALGVIPTNQQTGSQAALLPSKAKLEKLEKLEAAKKAAAKEAAQAKAKKAYNGPPVLAVTYFDAGDAKCPGGTFTGSVNVVVAKGEVTDVDAEVRVPADKTARPQPMIPSNGEWSTTMNSLPTGRTLTLAVTATGPKGSASHVEDISVACPGKPLDKKQKSSSPGMSAVEKEIRARIEKNRGDVDDYDFDFSFGADADSAKESKGADKTSGDEPATSPSADSDRGSSSDRTDPSDESSSDDSSTDDSSANSADDKTSEPAQGTGKDEPRSKP